MTVLSNSSSCREQPMDKSEDKKKTKDPLFEEIDSSLFGVPEYIINRYFFPFAHVCLVYSWYLVFTNQFPNQTRGLAFSVPWGFFTGLGVTVGAHRLWSHKTYKANLPLRFFLMVLQTISHQVTIYQWCLEHRIHHKYTDTPADPHNSKWGFWYSHIGWQVMPRTPEYLEKAKSFDMPDLENDPVVRFQTRYYKFLVVIFRILLPMSISYYVCEVPFLYCIMMNMSWYMVLRNATWCVNSVAHMFGDKPYDINISSTDNKLVSLLANGEGWHNYHHTFPWDYKASEFSGWKMNLSTFFIDFCAYMGWAYDLKTVSRKMLNQRLQRTGNQNHNMKYMEEVSPTNDDFPKDEMAPKDVSEMMKTLDSPIWGWDDESIPDDFRKVTRILRPSHDHGS